jgi:hypothetical protein
MAAGRFLCRGRKWHQQDMRGLGMEKRNFILYYLATIVLMFVMAYIYEFWIEEYFSVIFLEGDPSGFSSETYVDHWEYVITITLFSSVAMLFPTFIAYKMYAKRRNVQAQLDETLTKLVGGFVGICCVCKKVRIEDKQNKRAHWEDIDHYIKRRSDLEFIYGCCPECAAEAKQRIEDTH